MTKDGSLIISHDATVDRLTNGEGNIREMTLNEIKKLKTSDNQELLTLNELFDKYKKSVKYYIETKRPYEPDMDKSLIELLKTYDLVDKDGRSDNIIIQSFSEESLKNIRLELPKITLVQLTKTPDVEELNGIKIYADGVGPKFGEINKNYVQNAQARDLLVHPYTLNKKEEFERAIEYNVDGFFSNYPNKALEAVKWL